MQHIAVRKQSRESLAATLVHRSQAFILIASIIVLGLCAMTATIRLHQVEQQLAAQARV